MPAEFEEDKAKWKQKLQDFEGGKNQNTQVLPYFPRPVASWERIVADESAWRDERNRLEVDAEKAKLRICFGFQNTACEDPSPASLSHKKSFMAARQGKKYK